MISSVPSMKLSATAVFVLLMASPNVPENLTPGTFKATVPLIFPAMPLAAINKAPCPSVNATKSVVPSPRRSSTLEATTFTVVLSSAVPNVRSSPAVVARSKAKSPRRVWPAMVN